MHNSNYYIYMCVLTDAKLEGNKKDKSLYREKGKVYPFCGVIINNENFQKLRRRSWSQSDITKIKKLENHIKVRFNVYEDCTAEKMKTVLSTVESTISKNSSGLLVFIMTHGSNDDMLYGTDEKCVSVKDLVELFEGDKCQVLEKKPKIFIIHACRGKYEELVDPTQHRNDESHTEGPPPRSHNSDGTYIECIMHIMYSVFTLHKTTCKI